MLSQISATSRIRSETGSSKVSAAENFMWFKLAQGLRLGQERNAAKGLNWRLTPQFSGRALHYPARRERTMN